MNIIYPTTNIHSTKSQNVSIWLDNSFSHNYENEKIGGVYTPSSLMNEILSILEKKKISKNAKICIFHTIELAFFLSNKEYKNISIMTKTYNKNIEKLSKQLGIHYSIIRKKGNKMKFDVVLGNPPYNSNLHITFLKDAYYLSKEYVILIHPANWLTMHKPGKLLKQKQELADSIGNHFSEFTIFNGNKVFDIALPHPCSITLIDKKKNTPDVLVKDRITNTQITFSNIYKFFVEEQFFNELKSKIWFYCKNVDNLENNLSQNKKAYYVNIGGISGNINKKSQTNNFVKDDFYQFIYSSDRKITTVPLERKTRKGDKISKRYVSFNTEKEALNCLDYLTNSKIAKFSLMIVKNSNHLDRKELLYVPFFDFSDHWDDAKIAQKLKLTKEEIDFINAQTT